MMPEIAPIFVVRFKAQETPSPHFAWEATCEQCGAELSGDTHALLALDLAQHYRLHVTAEDGSSTASLPRSSMKSGEDEIEVLKAGNSIKGQVRIRELGGSMPRKCSILLKSDQLREHAGTCLVLADKIRNKADETTTASPKIQTP